jgi:hypothetical protein
LLALATAAVAVVTRVDAHAQARLDERLAALKQAGAPLTLEELARKPPLPDENAATYIRRAGESVDAIDKEVGAAYENESEADQQAIDLGRPTPAYLKAVRAALDAYPRTILLLKQASECPAYDSQLNYSAATSEFVDELLAQSQRNRAALRTLDYLVTLQIADGEYDAAVRTGIAMLRLCRLFDNEPLLVGALVAMACRGVAYADLDLALRSGDISDAVRDDLDAELDRSRMVDVYRRSLEGDRAFGLEVLKELAAGTHRATPENLAFAWQLPSGFKNDQSGYLDYMALSISLAGDTFARVKGNAELERSLAATGKLANLIAPATLAAQGALCRSLTYQRSVRVLSAIQRYEKAHPGQEPGLPDLKLPAEMTTDPFDGRPLHVVKKPGGWLIYGVDMNLKDDGGNVTPPVDCGFGPLPRVRED